MHTPGFASHDGCRAAVAGLTGTALVMLAACGAPVPGDLGLFDGALAPCPATPNCVSSAASDEAHRVAPFVLARGGGPALDRICAVLEQWPRTRVTEAGDDYLRVEVTSLVFRFVDDLELHRSQPDIVQVRSASRTGYSDLGVNRRRVENLRHLLIERGEIDEARPAVVERR